jgi:hypothetical protein
MPPEDVQPILKRLIEEIRYGNYSGMTNKEIYERIESKFADSFGEDFMMGFNLFQAVPAFDMYNNPDRPMSNYEYVDIGHTFNDLVSGIVGFGEMQNINRERLYGNKDDMEIIDAIIAKHPQRLTNRCLALITAEMRAVGINDNIGFELYVEKLFGKSGGNSMSGWDGFEETWNNLLIRPANVQQMAFAHNKALDDEPNNPFVLRVRDILVKLGAELGPNGLFLDPDGNPFVELNVEFSGAGDLIDELLETLEKHDENLRETRERYDGNRETRETDEEMMARGVRTAEQTGTEI